MSLLNSLKKGKISICDDKGKPGESINFTFNPSTYRITSSPRYKDVTHLGQDTEKKEFLGGVTRSLSATLIFDSYSDSDLFSTLEAALVVNMTLGVENKLKPGVLGIKNCTEDTWQAKLPDGKYYPIQPGKGFPIWKDLEVDFGKVKASM